MTVIKKIQDDSGSQFFPVTHERAVKDDNGTTLETKLQDINVAIDTTIPNHFTQVDSSIEQLLAANNELRTTVNNLVGISNNSFMGIFQTVNDLPTMTSPGWALVGTNLASLLLYTYTSVTNAWTKYSDDTYDFTDYSGLVTQVAQIGSKLGDLANLETEEKTNLVGAINEVKGIVGSYVDNPEFVYVKTDSEGKILFGIKVDGEPYFGVGCPKQVREYIEQKIADLSLDEYEDIVTFLSDYLGGDATLKSLLDSKLDAEGLDPEALATVQVVENPEFIQVITDSENKILWAIKTDGSIYYGAGVPQQVVDYINERIAELSLDEYEDIVAFLNNLEKGDKTLQTLLNEKVDKEEGKSLINSSYAKNLTIEDQCEYISIIKDNEGKILYGIEPDGTTYIPKLNVKEIGSEIVVTGIRDITNEVQSRLNNGGCVCISGGGTGYISQTLIIKKDNTHIIVSDNTTLKWTNPSYSVILRTLGGAYKWDNPNVGSQILDNISIEGGVWDLNGKNYSSGSDPSFIIADVTHLKIKGMKVYDPFKFFFGFGGIDNFEIRDISLYLNNPSIAGKDGLHFSGKTTNGIIENIRGNCSDDLIALNFGGDVEGDDTTNYMIRMGDSYNVVVKNIFCDGAYEAVRILAEDRYKCTDIFIDGIYGNIIREHCISISGWKYQGHNAHIGNISISNINVVGTNLDNPNIVNWKCPIVMLGNPWDNIVPCVIDSLKINNFNVTQSEGHIQTPIRLIGDVKVKNLLINGLTVRQENGADVSGYSVIDIGDYTKPSLTARLDNLILTNCSIVDGENGFDELISVQDDNSSYGKAVIANNIFGIPLPTESGDIVIGNNIII